MPTGHKEGNGNEGKGSGGEKNASDGEKKANADLVEMKRTAKQADKIDDGSDKKEEISDDQVKHDEKADEEEKHDKKADEEEKHDKKAEQQEKHLKKTEEEKKHEKKASQDEKHEKKADEEKKPERKALPKEAPAEPNFGEPLFKMKLEPSTVLTFANRMLANKGVKLATQRVIMTNTTGVRQTFKVKCTANKLFRIKPSLGFCELSRPSVLLVTFWGTTIPPDGKHYFVFYHMKCDECAKSCKALWTKTSKPEGVLRLRIYFEILTGDQKPSTPEPQLPPSPKPSPRPKFVFPPLPPKKPSPVSAKFVFPTLPKKDVPSAVLSPQNHEPSPVGDIPSPVSPVCAVKDKE